VLASAEDFQAVGVDEGVEVDASCEQDFGASGDEFHPNDSLGVVEIKSGDDLGDIVEDSVLDDFLGVMRVVDDVRSDLVRN